MILEFIIILFLCVFQSIFGVGLLLFGTPTFLLIGYDFVTTLAYILPLSITISIFQIFYKNNLDRTLLVQFNFFCLPPLFIFLLFSITINSLDIKLLVSLMLIISSLLTLLQKKILFWKNIILKYKKICLVVIGTIHGFTNMGGGFLSIFSTLINGDNKLVARGYIAYGYCIMGIVQYITIMIFSNISVSTTNWYYLILPIILFLPSQKIFEKINFSFFKIIINYLAIFYGIVTFNIALM